MMFNRGFYGLSNYCGTGLLSGWHYLIMIGLTLAVAGIIILTVIRKKSHRNDRALDMLKKKFVSGDITEEEYLNRKDVLNRK